MNLSYLYTPIQTVVDPPIDTKDQELPLEKLSWEDFEKLCLAIIQLEFNINVCEIYGIKGQAQEGIDIFARQANGRYSSYQCKRYQEFDFGDLQKAVDYFKDKKFYDQSDKLYLCTSCEWNKTQIQDKFEELKTELEKVNIELVKWDKIQLSRFLKTQPQIVYDYFGEAWVKKFNGDAARKQLSKSKKLDANQVVKYRNELYEFYSTIFNIQDPGIPIKELNNPYIIQDRFIVPDIISNLNEDNFEIGGEKISKLNDNDQERFYHEDYWYGQNEEEDRSKKIKFKDTIETNSIDIRLKIDEALINSDRNIIIGDPGAGKSTLLRYIVLDILSPNPKLENISQKYGKLLPVWLPFAFITRHLSLNDSLSISEILNLWFKSFGKTNLFDLASNALEDERLFLIIDGIDEWNNISSAQQAITRVETIRGLYDCQVLYSSRPYGFRILKDYFTNLKVLNLAGFSNSQQRDFVERWYSKWASLQKDIKDTEFSKIQSNHFIKELKKTGDLKKLAETPLLLSILIIQKLRDSVLPKNKLEALKDITQYLINKHPAKRVSDAGIVDDKTIDLDYKDIFCELAIHIQYASNDGVILKNEARKIIEKYLINYAAYDKVKAKVRSKELIDVGANSFGIIVEKSNDEISFSHKQFQEFLAAQYLFESDEEFADDFIEKFAGNPTCHQIVVSFFGLIPIKQVNKFKKFFEVLNNANHEVYQENYLKLLSYEIAINLDNAPIEIVNNSFDLIISDFELETEPLYKEALLRRILAALQSVRLKEKVQEFLIRYVPNQAKYRDHRVNPLGFVNRLNTSQFEFLTKVFINGTTQIRYDASHVFKKHITDQRVKDFLNNIILSCSNPEILALAINSIITNDLVQNDVDTLLRSVKVKAPIVEFFLHKYKVFIKKQTAKDLDGLLSVLNEMPYELKQEVVNLLIDGYGKSKKLKKILIKSTQQESRFSDDFTTDDLVAWKVLFHCYNKDPEVIELIKLEFDKEYPFSGERYDILRYLVHYFQGNQVLKPTVEKWLSIRLEDYHSIDNESAFACVFIKSENTKNILLNDLNESGIAHWPVMALLDGWPDDLEINDKLKNYFKTATSKKTAAAAGFIPKVFENDKVEGVKILEKILFDEKVYFRDRAIPALIELDKLYFERNVLERLLDVLESFPKDGFNQYYSAIEDIAKNFSSNSKVESYILRGVESDRNMYGVFAQYFPEKNNQEEKELKRSLPLSKKLRLLIIEKFNELNFLPSSVEEAFTYFDQEEEEEVKGDIALCVFNHLRLRNPDKIIELCNPLVFGRGFDHEIKRNIAFAGFLTLHKLDEYFLIKDDKNNSNEMPSPVDLFTSYNNRRSTSGLIVETIIDNFEYFISFAGKDFKQVLGRKKITRDIEDIWSFFARHSVKSSPSYLYLMEFITNNSETIQNSTIISFLNRTSPRSPILKDILLRIINSDNAKNKAFAGKILGTNFKDDKQVFENVIKVKDNFDVGRIIALCNGWPEQEVLRKIFDEIVLRQSNIDHYVGFNLKFLFRNIDNLATFLKQVLASPKESRRFHQYYFVPMIERISRDPEFCLSIKRSLLASVSVNEKISYYNLLSQVNMIDDEVRVWKSQVKDFTNDYGYDIVTNKEVRLKNILYDYYYHLN